MSSNGASNSAGNISERAQNVNRQDELTKMAPLLDIMNQFLTRNIESWKQENNSSPLYNLYACGKLEEKMQQLQESILVLAYLFRRKLWEVFNELFNRPDAADNEIFPLFRSIDDDDYMFHYLVHLACLYERVAFSYTKGINYVEEGKLAIQKYTDDRFFKHGGFTKLCTVAYSIHSFYELLVKPFRDRFPDNNVLTPFARAVYIIERQLRYKDWLKQIEEKKNAEENPKYNQKLQVLLSLDLQEYRLGYISVNKSLNQDFDSTSNTSSEPKHTPIADDSPSVTLEETDLKGNEILVPPNSSDKNIDTTQNEATNTTAYLEFEYTTLLIVSKNFLSKHMNLNENKEKLNFKRDVKIYCPEKQTEVSLFSKKTLDDNLHKCKSLEVIKGMHIFDIGSVGKFPNDEIILDTSSEEEDELDPESINHTALEYFREFSPFQMRKMKFLLDKYVKEKNALKLLFTKASGEGKSVESNGATPKAKTPVQRKPGCNAKSTGATLNGKTAIQMQNGSNEKVNGQNTPTSSHSSNSEVCNMRRRNLRDRRYTPDGKKEWRKKPVKRT